MRCTLDDCHRVWNKESAEGSFFLIGEYNCDGATFGDFNHSVVGVGKSPMKFTAGDP